MTRLADALPYLLFVLLFAICVALLAWAKDNPAFA